MYVALKQLYSVMQVQAREDNDDATLHSQHSIDILHALFHLQVNRQGKK